MIALNENDNKSKLDLSELRKKILSIQDVKDFCLDNSKIIRLLTRFVLSRRNRIQC